MEGEGVRIGGRVVGVRVWGWVAGVEGVGGKMDGRVGGRKSRGYG